MKRVLTLALLVLVAALAGCIGGESPVDPAGDEATAEAADPGFPACEHPWPCADGSEWPEDLEGPFDLREPKPLRIPGHDGIELEAYVWRPDVPEGTEVPTVVYAQPYAGQCSNGVYCFPVPRGDDPYWLDGRGLRPVVEAGYAVVNVNVRGTGASGGCFEFGGPNEAKDLARAVEWAAERSWSNGRVAMTGLSYMGTTPWMAAVHNPEPLKTIVPGGIVSDWYTWTHTPQGAAGVGLVGHPLFTLGLGVYPPVGAPENLPTWAEVAPEQACPELAHMLATTGSDAFRDDRNQDFWRDRQYIREFPNVTAAAFVFQGFADNGPHGHQDAPVWDSLEAAPTRMLLGDWGHVVPDSEELEGYPGGDAWSQVLIPWLDFWLKGLGQEPPRLGVVDYQTSDGEWHRTDTWPPSDHREEALYLVEGAMSPEPQDASPTFQATPSFPWSSQEPTLATPYCSPDSAQATFTTNPVREPVTLAGNPFAYLQVESDRPGGVVALDLYELGPDARCENGDLEGGAWLGGGGADLRFHKGNFEARDFPTGEPSAVRVDIINQAHVVGEGHRVAVVASGHGHRDKFGQPHTPTITLHGDGSASGSHVVLPVVEGTVGGDPVSVDYPSRPFTPPTSDGEVTR